LASGDQVAKRVRPNGWKRDQRHRLFDHHADAGKVAERVVGQGRLQRGLTRNGVAVRSRVWPSAVAVATALVPIAVAAPVRFSTMTGEPQPLGQQIGEGPGGNVHRASGHIRRHDADGAVRKFLLRHGGRADADARQIGEQSSSNEEAISCQLPLPSSFGHLANAQLGVAFSLTLNETRS
jgi:hypothetical protein